MTGSCEATYWNGVSLLFFDLQCVLARGPFQPPDMSATLAHQLCSQYNLIASFHFNGYFINVSTSKEL